MKKILALIMTIFLSLSCSSSLPVIIHSQENIPRNTFILLTRNVLSPLGGIVIDTMHASGVIIYSDDNYSLALTAAHVCSSKTELSLQSQGYKIDNLRATTIDNKKYNTTTINIEPKQDICLLYIKELKNNSYVLLASESPLPGDKVINIAAPLGIFDGQMIPIIEGRFNGVSNNRAYYTLPATFGSSGSMILNTRGELVGILNSMIVRFPIISISNSFSDLKKYYSDIVMHNFNKSLKY